MSVFCIFWNNVETYYLNTNTHLSDSANCLYSIAEKSLKILNSNRENEEEEELVSLNKIRYTITLNKKNIFYHIINESTVYPGL